MAVDAANDRGNLTIRPISPSDARQAAELSGELGYATTADAMRARICQLAKLEDRAVYVACLQEDRKSVV